jgi:phosphoglycerol transferase MdoB-like AlkP superfamily enzyme
MIFEKVSGILIMGGFLWLQLLFVVWAVAAFIKKLFPSPVRRYVSSPFIHRWALVSSLGVIASLFPTLGLWEASMRYLGDIAGGMSIIAIIAAFWLIRRSDESRVTGVKGFARVLVITLAMHSCFVGFFSAFHGFDEPFINHNPNLFAKMSKALSICE